MKIRKLADLKRGIFRSPPRIPPRESHRITITLDHNAYIRLATRAHREQVSMSELAAQAVKRFLSIPTFQSGTQRR